MKFRAHAFSGLLIAMAIAPLSAHAQSGQAPPPTQVGFITIKTEAVPLITTIPGRAIAQDSVAIRPRVSGIVSDVLYDPSKPITVGQPLFKIDPTTYEAALAEAQANLASANAALPQTESAYSRSQQLQGSGSTQAALELAKASRDQAAAAVKAAESAVTLAETELSWTTIESPIAGLASVADVSPGDLVTAQQTDPMTTVTTLDPIDVEMYEPSARLQRIRSRIESGQITPNDTLNAVLTLENGVSYAATGEMVAPGYTVSTSTGAIDFRFRFDNHDRRILPGMFVRGQVELGTMQAILVPQSAATRSRDGKLSAWVVEDGKAAKRAIVDEGVDNSRWIITSGLKDGDQLIVNGSTNLSDGAPIAPVPVAFDENGVARDVAQPSGAAPEASPPADAKARAAPAETSAETPANPPTASPAPADPPEPDEPAAPPAATDAAPVTSTAPAANPTEEAPAHPRPDPKPE